MKNYYILVKNRNYWIDKTKTSYSYLKGMPNTRLSYVQSKKDATYYNEEDKDFLLNVFKQNGSSIKIQKI